MIEVHGLTKSFGALSVLRGVDLAPRAGRVTAIIGPNGAGKTTLIKILLGLARPDAGTILFDGVPIARDGAYRARVGYMPQAIRFPSHLTGCELLATLAAVRGQPNTLDDELIERFGLAEHLHRSLGVLSGGTCQKINAVAAFCFRPELFVLDEPTAGLDPLASSILKDRIIAERADGRTVLLASHIMTELEELADDVVFLLDGRACYAGSAFDLKRITRQTNLERAIANIMMQGVAA